MLRRSLATLAVAVGRSQTLLGESTMRRGGDAKTIPVLAASIQPRAAALVVDLLHRSSFASSSSSSSSPAAGDGETPSLDARLDAVNRLFSSAREDLEDAQEDEGTVHFEESFNAAYKGVHDTLEAFENVLASLGEEQRGSVRRSMGLKMEQLKAELAALEPH